MIVCVCKNVSDHKIRQAVDRGACSLADVRESLGVGTCCGKCHSYAKQVVRERVNELSERESLFQPIMLQAIAL
jgi:bacterioferritin-associated ferredoxin